MRRRLFNLAAALSLVLWVLAAALWIRSYFVADVVGYATPDAAFDTPYDRVCASARGGLVFIRQSVLPPQTEQDRVADSGFQRLRQFAPKRPTAFRYGRGTVAGWSDQHRLIGNEGSNWIGFGNGHQIWGRKAMDVTIIPQWLLVVVFAALPGRWLMLWRRRRGPLACATCGYDLRATPDRCPECGKETVSTIPA